MAITTVPFWHLLQDERLDTTSCATYFDKSGVMKVSTVNLVTQSQEFWETEWSKTNVTVDANFIPSPFNPTSNAEAIVNSNGSGNHYVSNTVTFADNTVYCHSVYAQRYSVTNIVVAIVLKDGTTVGRTFDLINGTDTPILDLTDPLRPAQAGWATQPTYHGIEYVAGLPGEEWYRCWVAHNVGTGATNTNNIRIYSSDNYTTVNHSGDGNMYFLWGDKVEIGTSPTDYNRTETVPCSGARIDYDPVTLKSNGMMIEEQRTNLLTYSEQFDNAAWTLTVNVTATKNVISPDGTANATSFVENTATSQRILRQDVTSTGSNTHSFTFYAKPLGTGSQRWLGVRLANAPSSTTNYIQAVFDLTAGTVHSTGGFGDATFTSATAIATGGGWYRIQVIGIPSASATSVRVSTAMSDSLTWGSNYTGDGVSGYIVWGAQLEAGAFPTSYIPTTTASVTRATDRIRSFNGSELYTNTGTYVIEAVSYNDSSVRYLFGATDAIDTNKVVFVELDNNDVKFIAQNISSSAGTITPNQPFRLAYGFTSGDQDVSLNHSTLSSGVTLISSVSDHLVIGADESFGNTFNGYIRRIIYFDTKFQDSVIQQLSAL